MRYTIILLACAVFSSGCMSNKLDKTVKALAKDPAIVVVTISSIYGTVKLTRVGSVTNGLIVQPDGSVAVKQQ